MNCKACKKIMLITQTIRFINFPKILIFKVRRFRKGTHTLNGKKMKLLNNLNFSKVIATNVKTDLQNSLFELFGFIEATGTNYEDCKFRAVVKKRSDDLAETEF